MAATLRDTSSNSDAVFDMPDPYTDEEGQTVIPSESYKVEQIRFYATWGHSDPGTCYVSIEATTDGLPNGNKLTDNAAFSVAGGQAKTLRTVNFTTQPTLSNGTTYAIVFECPGGETNVKELIVWGSAYSSYTGNRVRNVSGVWQADASNDLYFQLWGSDPVPNKPINPTPEHEGSGVTLHGTTVTWEDGGGATSYDVYYGTLSGFLSLVAEDVTELEAMLIAGNFPHYGEIYYWRIDAKNASGTTQGDEWSFTTLIFDPPLPTGITLDEDGNPTGTPTGENNMYTVKRLIAAANNAIWYGGV